jgi:hypothetical protein
MIAMKTQKNSIQEKIFVFIPQPLLRFTGQTEATKGISLGTISVKNKKWQAVLDRIPSEVNQSGVYVFWWKVNEEFDLPDVETTRHWVKGKKKGKHDPKPLPTGTTYIIPATSKKDTKYLHYAGRWAFEPVTIGKDTYVPLYVGKSTNMFERVKQHLSWPESCQVNKSKQVKSKKLSYSLIPRNGTARQFGDGFHFLFRGKQQHLQYAKLQYVHLSVAFTDYVDYASRFYAEDYLIGSLRPPFNLDSER